MCVHEGWAAATGGDIPARLWMRVRCWASLVAPVQRTWNPACATRSATARPAGPDPTTTTSKVRGCVGSYSGSWMSGNSTWSNGDSGADGSLAGPRPPRGSTGVDGGVAAVSADTAACACCRRRRCCCLLWCVRAICCCRGAQGPASRPLLLETAPIRQVPQAGALTALTMVPEDGAARVWSVGTRCNRAAVELGVGGGGP